MSNTWSMVIVGGSTVFVLATSGIPSLNNILNHFTPGSYVSPNSGYQYSWSQNGNVYTLSISSQYRGSVPIPGTLLLFGGGWAGFAAWNWVRTKRHKKQEHQ